MAIIDIAKISGITLLPINDQYKDMVNWWRGNGCHQERGSFNKKIYEDLQLKKRTNNLQINDMKASTIKKRIGLIKRLKMQLLFGKIKRHYRNIDWIYNNWTLHKCGLQYIRPHLNAMYFSGKYIYANGVPIYNILTGEYQSDKHPTLLRQNNHAKSN